MIALLDTSTDCCKLILIDDQKIYDHQWQAGRQLARGLFDFVERSMAEHDICFKDLSGLGIYRGPGSYTGLRIGITVWNTVADAQQLPIVGVTGKDWQAQAKQRLSAGDDDKLVLPEYGGLANITKPKK